MISNKVRTYHLTTSDNRKTLLRNKVLKDLQEVLSGLESTKFHLADILVCFSYTGDFVSKKLFKQITRFQNDNKKCYVYSDYGKSIREIIRIEKSEKNFETKDLYGVIIHAGMKIEKYRTLVDTKSETDSTIPQ